jgi:hypothetical protein
MGIIPRKRTGLFLATCLWVAACSNPTSDPAYKAGTPCTEAQEDEVRCGLSGTDAVAVLACQALGDEYFWLVVEECPVACTAGACTGSGPGWDTTDPGTDTLPGDTGPLPDGETPPDTGLFCEPGELTCLTDAERGICNADGSAWDVEFCEAGTVCDAGFCMEPICEPGVLQGLCLGPNSFGVCSEQGTQWIVGYCEQGQTCYEGDCVNYECPPGSTICKGMTAVQECQEQPDGSYIWVVTDTCDGGLCQDGACLGACEVNIKENSYLGCDYWALDLANFDQGGAELVALVVSAPVEGEDATVTITDMSTVPPTDLTPATLQVADMVVPAGGLEVFMLPPNHDIPVSSLTTRSFKVETDAPVTVHQFNPLNGENVFTNDASLLLPDNVGAEEYLIMSWPVRESGAGFVGYFTLVATQPGETQVEVWPTGAVVAGDGVPALGANQSQTFTLQQGQVLSLGAASTQGNDLTGTRVLASQKISVFGGHECANVPSAPYVNYCDHVEQQLFPLQAWGDTYVADAFMPRNGNQKDTWRIMAGEAGVNVTLSPLVAGPFNNMQKGQYVEFAASGSFDITATGPILVGHYLQGSNYPGYSSDSQCGGGGIFDPGTGIGDPAFTLVVPTDQFLDSYVFLTPNKYSDDYINLTGPNGTNFLLDGAPVTGVYTPIPGPGGMGVYQLPIADGVHSVTADNPFGLTVYGYDCDVSYAYPGGLRLESLQ